MKLIIFIIMLFSANILFPQEIEDINLKLLYRANSVKSIYGGREEFARFEYHDGMIFEYNPFCKCEKYYYFNNMNTVDSIVEKLPENDSLTFISRYRYIHDTHGKVTSYQLGTDLKTDFILKDSFLYDSNGLVSTILTFQNSYSNNLGEHHIDSLALNNTTTLQYDSNHRLVYKKKSRQIGPDEFIIAYDANGLIKQREINYSRGPRFNNFDKGDRNRKIVYEYNDKGLISKETETYYSIKHRRKHDKMTSRSYTNKYTYKYY